MCAAEFVLRTPEWADITREYVAAAPIAGRLPVFIGGTGTAAGSSARVNESEQTVRLSPVSTLK